VWHGDRNHGKSFRVFDGCERFATTAAVTNGSGLRNRGSTGLMPGRRQKSWRFGARRARQ